MILRTPAALPSPWNECRIRDITRLELKDRVNTEFTRAVESGDDEEAASIYFHNHDIIEELAREEHE